MAYTGDPYEIVPRLESLGEPEVRRLLGTREFGDPGSITRSVVEDWLRRKEAEATLSIAREANSIARKARSAEKKISPADRIINKIKRHRFVTLAIVVGTITIAVGSFFGAVTKIAEFIDRFVDPRPTTVKELQDAVSRTAIELKEEFESVTSRSGKAPPIPSSDFSRVNRLIARIERLDPGNGHATYYKGFIVRWRGQRLASHPTLFVYLERAKDPKLHLPGDNGDARFCFDNWLGYCKQRQAFINHFLALDFERAAEEEKDRAVALARLKASLERAEIAIKLYGEFNAPGQGTPTRTLAESLRKKIAEMQQSSK